MRGHAETVKYLALVRQDGRFELYQLPGTQLVFSCAGVGSGSELLENQVGRFKVKS